MIGGYALLGLLGGNYAYEQEVKALHVYADSVFHEAFHVELQKRGIVILVMNKTNHYLYHGYYKKRIE